MKIISGHITAPLGFHACGVHSGVKKKKLDLALIYSEQPATAAAVVTQNELKAAPVLVTQQHIKHGILQAIVINSGNANACTGNMGLQHAQQMATETAHALKVTTQHVAVASTGVIGVPMPIDKITTGIQLAAQSLMNADADSAIEAIMTTDTFMKHIAVECQIGNKTVKIGGIAKGSGMIHPNMATMLGFITTDAAITTPLLQQALRQINEDTFNMVSVDGDTSTNDMVIAMANGMACNPCIEDNNTADFNNFCDALQIVCTHLAKEIARDGEGAGKMMEIQVSGAATDQHARLAARAICCSSLVKTAIYGADANWGRIACAAGYSGAEINIEQMYIKLGEHLLFKDGKPLPFDEAILTDILQQKNILIAIHLGVGVATATAWGCDLTHDYVNINAAYRS